MKTYISYIDTPFSILKIEYADDCLCRINFVTHTSADHHEDEFSKRVKREIAKYFADANHIFNVPVQIHGSDFQLKTWTALRNIKVGETLTYANLARKLKTSPRAIGQACKFNPLPLIIPCHRVVAQNHLGGFFGASDFGLGIKKWLLKHEQAM